MPSFEFERVRIVDDDVTAQEIIRDMIFTEKREEAFHICDLGEIFKRHKQWLSKIPRIVPHYAVKANSNPNIIECLAAIGAHFDCASKQEIIQVQRYGVEGDRIIYAIPVKPLGYIQFAKECGVYRMTVDNINELNKIKEIFPDAKIVIRIRCDSKNAGMPLGLKFGCDPDYQVYQLIHTTKDLGLNLLGFSFHVGSPCGDILTYTHGIETCKRLIDYSRSIGHNSSLIDIGGGIPGEMGNEREFEEFANIINNAIKDIDPSISFISEPGRYYVRGSTHAAACVIGKTSVTEDGKSCFLYYLNDGIFGSFWAPIMRHSPVLLNDRPNSKKYLSKLWGPTGDPFDFSIKDYLPELYVNEWLIWDNMGAYTTVFSNSFNGFFPPVVYPYIRKSDWQALQDEIYTIKKMKQLL